MKQGFKPQYDWEFAKQLYEDGKLDGQIASFLGCTREGVRNWRHKNKLIANMKPILVTEEDFKDKAQRVSEKDRIVCANGHLRRYVKEGYRKNMQAMSKLYKKTHKHYIPLCIGCGKSHECYTGFFKKEGKIYVPAYCKDCKKENVMNELFVKP